LKKVLESDIPKRLVIGETYNSKEIYYFLGYNDVIILCEDTSMFSDKSPAKYTILGVHETFVHRNENGNTYHIPVKKKKVYVIRKV
jgi:hypothetical protein